jgi:hypothetical protein
MIVSRELSGIYGILLSTQGTSCFKPRGSTGSSPLRSDGSHDYQAGEAGLVEQSSAEAKSLKLRAKGLSGCHPSAQQPRQPEGGAKKKNYSHDNLLKETEPKAALTGSTIGLKQPAKESTTIDEKGKTLTLCSKLEVAEGCDVRGDEVGDE